MNVGPLLHNCSSWKGLVEERCFITVVDIFGVVLSDCWQQNTLNPFITVRSITFLPTHGLGAKVETFLEASDERRVGLELM